MVALEVVDSHPKNCPMKLDLHSTGFSTQVINIAEHDYLDYEFSTFLIQTTL